MQASNLFGVTVKSTTLPNPMSPAEFAEAYAGMPDTDIPADAGDCEEDWSDVDIGGQPYRIYSHPCTYVYALTTVGDRGYVFTAVINYYMNEGPWIPTFMDMLASVTFEEVPPAP